MLPPMCRLSLLTYFWPYTNPQEVSLAVAFDRSNGNPVWDTDTGVEMVEVVTTVAVMTEPNWIDTDLKSQPAPLFSSYLLALDSILKHGNHVGTGTILVLSVVELPGCV